jgi:UDP-2,3-diacylglucosamine pyrophosphatase LpxH
VLSLVRRRLAKNGGFQELPDVRYVILSDLHFGAENSILTALDSTSDPCADPTKRSAVLEGFVECIATLIEHNEGHDPPTLILAGDILELALADDEVATAVFEQFTDLVIREHRLFADEIWYVPGNHDHHLWESARERLYAETVRSLPPETPFPPPTHATRLFAKQGDVALDAALLTAVIQRHNPDTTSKVRVVYPNLGLVTQDSKRVLAVHHGHFIESMYLLMSNLNQLMFDKPLPKDVAEIEEDNFAWIDFFWSSLGRSGDVGEDVNRIYDMLQSEKAVDQLVLTLATAISQRAPGGRFRRRVTRAVVRDLFTHVLKRAGRLERHHPTDSLSANAQKGLQVYLEGPLYTQLSTELGSAPQTTLVFGHTHKPFESQKPAAGFGTPVRLANTGGWVVDTIGTNPLQGASAVLADENLDVVSVRLYEQQENPSDYAVRFVPVTDPDCEFAKRLSEVVRPDAGSWQSLSGAVSVAVPERHAALQTIIDRSTAARSRIGDGLKSHKQT